MRKTINITALLFFIWLVLDAFDVPDKLVYFLIIGELPGTATTLSPTLMLAIMTGLTGIVVFEILARRFDAIDKLRQSLFGTVSRREQLPTRRFTQI